jgi:hypothetical protein
MTPGSDAPLQAIREEASREVSGADAVGDVAPAGPDRPPLSATARIKLTDCALGIEHGRVWHIFRRVRGEWRHYGRLSGLPSGRQGKLLKLFAEGGGLLEKHAALQSEKKHYSGEGVDKLMGLVKPEISRLREIIRQAFSLPSDSADPLPFVTVSRGWLAKIYVGYAVQEDGDSLGGETRLRFKTKEEL